MLIIMTSPAFLMVSGKPDKDIVAILVQAKKAGHPVALVSNHEQPT
ncbi:hypothetical protein GTP55_01245 [Duganella sp. FT109W]|uniref:Uncharacterized protein n=1 Tax=Duganella margarita TaxID=2692170 RepID=A0ABW9WAK8_9BURK|nr:hypothetical protein [Duganella margarita]MYN37991.1 hypothetical protein [Duganella margarita]